MKAAAPVTAVRLVKASPSALAAIIKEMDAIINKHMPGKHDQSTHGRRGTTAKVGHTDGHSVIEKIETISTLNDNIVKAHFDAFAKQHAASAVEHGLVLSPDGKAYHVKGISSTVGVHLVGEKALRGASIIHNHPDSYGMSGDAFSLDDFKGFFRYNIRELQVVTSKGRFSLRHSGKRLMVEQADTIYKAAYLQVLDTARRTGDAAEFAQLETLKRLHKEVKGLTFKRVDN